MSASGLLMYVPAAAPVAPGQAIRLTIGDVSSMELASLDHADMEATIMRVDHDALLDAGHIAVGVQFTPQA